MARTDTSKRITLWNLYAGVKPKLLDLRNKAIDAIQGDVRRRLRKWLSKTGAPLSIEEEEKGRIELVDERVPLRYRFKTG